MQPRMAAGGRCIAGSPSQRPRTEKFHMTRPRLTYFDAPMSRGEECRLALHLAGIDFEDNRISQSAWPALKEQTPYGALPVLELAGHPPLAQTNPILVLIGRRHGLHPSDDFEAARHEAMMQ